MIDLDDLEELFDDLSFDEPTPEQVFKMYGIFLNDFVKSSFYLKGKQVKHNKAPSNHYNHLFRNKNETFVHLITRESKIKKMRDFDSQRANRIHWIKPILENANDKRIWYFERHNTNNEMCEYYWYESRDFLVILKRIEPDVLLITSFYVDKTEKVKYKIWFQDYKAKKNPTYE
jgi:hypothetical protein